MTQVALQASTIDAVASSGATKMLRHGTRRVLHALSCNARKHFVKRALM